jgi:uncharacterized protein (TIGR03118 family)
MADNDLSTVFDKANILGLLNGKLSGNSYGQTNLVANKAEYNPLILEPTFTHGWGLSYRPAGNGGHFWVIGNGSGISYEYVGDVNGTPLFQDGLKEMTVPAGPDGSQGSPTGSVFNGSSNFVITQDYPTGAITAPTKFFFGSINGTISAWTERKLPDGTFEWPSAAITVIDGNAEAKGEYNSIYFGVATDKAGNHLYAADVSDNHRIQVFDGNFKDITATSGFVNPFVGEEGLQLGGFAPFNVQTLTNKDGKESVFVTYATVREAPPPSSVFFAAPPLPGAPPPSSKIAEFDTDGNLIRVWDDGGLLQAAYGVAYAPDNFGGLSDTLLVGNFNSGTVVAFDPNTHKAIDYLRDDTGKTLVADGIWGMLFGNGASLGDTDSLYYSAGPNNAVDGVFGRVRWDSSRTLLPAEAQSGDFTQTANKLLALDPSIVGGDDDNVLFGTEKSDFFQAGKGNNTMVGGKADSVFVAGDGNNTAYGSEGANLFNFGNGHNTMSMYGGQGMGIFTAGDGNNTVLGGLDRNLVMLGNGNNTVYTGSGTNIIMTGNGNNSIYASDDRDYIYTGAGDDIIYAGQGDDVISPGTGNDIVHLGSGSNLPILDKGEGSATVWNFKDNDSISFGTTVKKADSITTQLSGFDTQVFAGGDLLATLLNTQGNIQFV